MNTLSSFILYALIFSSLLFQPSSFSFAQSLTPAMEQCVANGIDNIFMMQFDKSEQEFDRCLKENPQHPYGHFARALSRWARYMYDTEQDQADLIPEFEKRIEEAIKISNTWIDQHPNDARGLLSLGGIYGLASRLDVIQKNWLRAYFRGRKAIRHTRLSLKKDPQLYDAYMGIGMYDYYSDALPRFIGVLSRIVLRGDRKRGIEELKIAAEKGTYTQLASKLILIEIYTEDPWGAKNAQEALGMVRSVRAKYPSSSLFHLTEIICHYEAGDYERAKKLSEDFVIKIEQKKATYRFRDRPKAYVSLGMTLWGLKDLSHAKEAFQKAIHSMGKGPSRWGSWAHIRLGQLEDMADNREEAKKLYQEVLKTQDFWGFHKVAKKLISHPYLKGTPPGPIPPP
ncbi:MAG: hypothetical protein HY399_02955 [Elusimicrobia bacterium]|nr:hypothetical protein [Elusimicrobiota bacterium]